MSSCSGVAVVPRNASTKRMHANGATSLKDPSVFDPGEQWPRYALYVIVLPKVLPTLALYVIANERDLP